MKKFRYVFVCILLASFLSNYAQSINNPVDFVRNQFEGFNLAFNNQDVDRLIDNYLAIPLTLRNGENVTLINNKQEATAVLNQLFDGIVKKGWVGSKVINTEICKISNSIVLLDNTYSRLKKDGSAIPPTIRKTLQVWQKKNEEWRIVSFYFHDANVDIGCR